jgi:hypothetical protein
VEVRLGHAALLEDSLDKPTNGDLTSSILTPLSSNPTTAASGSASVPAMPE